MESLMKCRQRRIRSFISSVCLPVLLLLLIGSTEVDATSKAAVVAAAPVVAVAPVAAAPAITVVPPKAAPAPVVAIPPVGAAAPVIAPPKAAPAPVVAKPPVVAAPMIAPVGAVPVIAPVGAVPVIAPVAAPKPAVNTPVSAPAKAPTTAIAPAAKPPATVAPAAGPATALAPSTGIPLDAAQVKALNKLGITADADACSSIPATVLKCDRNATTQHLVSLNAQDCPAAATLTEADLAALSPYLTELSFMNCALQGPLPQPTDRMAATLTSLTVTGAPVMPGWWIGRMTNLKTVHVQDTYVNASGLAVIISGLSNLQELTIANASVSGALPTTWPAAATLTTVDLSGNQLSGSIPVEITKIPTLTVLDLSHNRLNDHIISGLGNLQQLTSLSLSNNQLHLAIPKTLGQMSSLSKLDLSVNKLNGTVPVELALLPLTYLDLSNNSLTGALPFDDVFMSKLTTFKIAGNPGLCYNSSITSAKAAGAFGLPLCGALEPALAPEYYGPAGAPEAAPQDSGASPAPKKKKTNLVIIIIATVGALVALAAIVYCCCRYWGSKAGYN